MFGKQGREAKSDDDDDVDEDVLDDGERRQRRKRRARESTYVGLEGPTFESTGTRGVLRSGALYRKTNRGFYATLGELQKAHQKLFSDESKLHVIGKNSIESSGSRSRSGFSSLSQERSVSGRETGLVEATLRIRHGKSEEEVGAELVKAFRKLFSVYEDGNFEVRKSDKGIFLRQC